MKITPSRAAIPPRRLRGQKEGMKMNVYYFGTNDERGHLIELNIPAETEVESKLRLEHLVGKKKAKEFWLNDVREYS